MHFPSSVDYMMMDRIWFLRSNFEGDVKLGSGSDTHSPWYIFSTKCKQKNNGQDPVAQKKSRFNFKEMLKLDPDPILISPTGIPVFYTNCEQKNNGQDPVAREKKTDTIWGLC